MDAQDPAGDGKADDLGETARTAPGETHPRVGRFAPVKPETWGSATWPQGGRFVSGEGSNLRVGVYAGHATRVLLEIYTSPTGASASRDYWLARGSDGIWRGELANVPGKTVYAFRVWGPNWPFDPAWRRGGSNAGFRSDVDNEGNRYNPNKVLFDPYALELSHDKVTPALFTAGFDGDMYGTGGQLYHGVTRRSFDTGRWAPKAVALVDSTATGARPAVAARDAVIYEAHVRGLTAHTSASSLRALIPEVAGLVDIPAECRGTYRAAGLMAPYLKGLGVNVLELLPIQESNNDAIELDPAVGNYWGYMTDGFFAPDRRYACDRSPGGPTRELKEMVRALHAAGIEVWLDVVYNHTGEGGPWKGDTTRNTVELSSLRGFDNRDFYALVGGDPASFWESTGTGNNFNVTTDVGRRLVTDSLRYWSATMGIDGFRFDVATALGRDASPTYAFNRDAKLLRDIATLAEGGAFDIVAEPWDLGAYSVGEFPAGWGEWNGRYRDASRRFLRGDTSGSGGLNYAGAFYGDFDHFNDQGGPARTVNLLVAHDGFTLADLVSYDGKTNTARAWPFGPSDGGNDNNDSWSSGGDKALRRQRLRNAMVWQTLSRGVPMLVAGDELGRTQNGNNNPYNIDSVGTWTNYGMIASDAPQLVATGAEGEAYHDNLGTDTLADGRNGLFAFTRAVLALRRDHVALRQGDYKMPISFARADGTSGFNAAIDRAVRIHLDGSAVGDRDFVVLANMADHNVDFTPPPADAGQTWVRLVDTGGWAETEGNTWSEATGTAIDGHYGVNAWSIVVLGAR